MRCPMTHTSKYAYKAKPKQCLNPSSVRVCLPLENEITHVKVAFVYVCAMHHKAVAALKINTIRQLNTEGYGVLDHKEIDLS